MISVRALAHKERREFADLLDGLSPQQWQAPTLCADWTVRDVVAHTVAYLGQTRLGLTAAMLAARGQVDRINESARRTHAGLEPDHLRTTMRLGADPSGAGALYGCRAALIECLIHQQDIRRPLGLTRVLAEPPLLTSLTFARVSPVIGGALRTRGLRLIATDLDWSAGRGPEIHGPGEALLLAMTGRVEAVAAELHGPGLAHLCRR
ncbi:MULTISPECIES: maleylpyruvate isomerase family mycothiol-dependent enzyme [unclassified Mycolicibacterium]|uniref:maleylpyruvate isomerase family mycothiol-dependent enzyme n=1 Tax=unclassified Mycolicibacterium TaxID=2636767 RepID=UPI0012DE4748|nr:MULTISPECIES: maleylpyruvate isomerase family mycothiol-dependent enzyme [unclassified Mycolicibacterium]MUL83565.1 maleylpyruvate isomerase family mycothiol-dependent enzyme [Mycolicibacterium sp. CBMA 329]MUL90556.1 maleylpyruvate isomerase family mycothiol-dependent enzyme [Mycolicibacterium sp. CBMA 331]MUM00527.1 maleylpyruvate isomerase family mycothiol-dependent enzyme [Mycolicibacterium sp. CBMA 334]MUM25418.1 maleylpyruvate isomerase family mycothiol-dependent enzyme [Mycolicibacter